MRTVSIGRWIAIGSSYFLQRSLKFPDAEFRSLFLRSFDKVIARARSKILRLSETISSLVEDFLFVKAGLIKYLRRLITSRTWAYLTGIVRQR